VAQEGIARLEVALPVLADLRLEAGGGRKMGRVIVGVDPHKKSVTIETVDDGGTVLARGRFDTDTAGYRLMVKHVREQWPHHRWAVEGAQGVGRPLAQRLLAQGETVLDVPAKLAARVRVFDTGNARKTDATDAHAIAMVALRTPRLRELAYDEELIALRLLTDRPTSCPTGGCKGSTDSNGS
jgi:transposase